MFTAQLSWPLLLTRLCRQAHQLVSLSLTEHTRVAILDRIYIWVHPALRSMSGLIRGRPAPHQIQSGDRSRSRSRARTRTRPSRPTGQHQPASRRGEACSRLLPTNKRSEKGSFGYLFLQARDIGTATSRGRYMPSLYCLGIKAGHLSPLLTRLGRGKTSVQGTWEAV